MNKQSSQPETGQPEINELREALEARKIATEIAQLECEASTLDRQTHVNELMANYVPTLDEDVGYAPGAQFVDSREPYYDTPGFHGYGRLGLLDTPTKVDDDKDGSYQPFWRNMNEYRMLQGTARYLGTCAHEGIALVEGLADYAIYTGFKYDISAKDRGDESQATESLVAKCQEIIDEFHKRTQWPCDCESEVFCESRYYGEQFLRVKDVGGGKAELQIIPPFQIADPDPKFIPDLEDFFEIPLSSWTYGVVTDRRDFSQVRAYYHDPDFIGTNYELIPAQEVVHIKLNVPKYVKRGLSDFYPVYRLLKLLPTTIYNTVIQAAIQATIAGIREHTSAGDGPPVALGNTISGPVGAGGRGVNPTQVSMERPGQMLDTRNVKFHKGPVGDSGAEALLRVYEVGWRTVGVRYRMPEYMSSGNTGSSNRSTSDSAETPFVRSTERKQTTYAGSYGEVAWKVLAIAIKSGQLRLWGIRTRQQLERRIAMAVQPPEVRTRKRKEEIEGNKTLVDAKAMSKQTLAEKEGLDWESEKQRIEEESKQEFLQPAPVGFGQPGSANDPKQPPVDPKRETTEEVAEELASAPRGGQSLPGGSTADGGQLTESQRFDAAAALIWEDYECGSPELPDA